MIDHRARLLAILGAILAASLLRTLPHPPNFTPVGALALFSGARLGWRPLAFAAPAGAMLIADSIIGFHALMPFVYGSLALAVLLGGAALRRATPLRIAGAAFASSLVFFIITNFGVWLQLGTYPHTPQGLVTCYVAALPYFQNSLAGDLFWSAILFGGWALAEKSVPAIREDIAVRS